MMEGLLKNELLGTMIFLEQEGKRYFNGIFYLLISFF